MPRIGLPAKPPRVKSAGSGAAGSASALQMLRIAGGATAFRVVSALVAAFCAVVFSRSASYTPDAFGLYPIFTHQVDRLLGHWLARPLTPSLVVSWLAFAGAMVMLLRVALLDLDGDEAEGAVLLAVVFPFAVIFDQRSADALFLLFTLGAFWGFREQKWIAGGVAGALATATSPTGIVIVPALAWIGFRTAGATRIRVAGALLLTIAGFGAYLSYMYYLAGPPGGWATAFSRWGFHVGQAPWLSLQHLLTTHPSVPDATNGAVTLIALASVPFVWWKLGGGYAIYMLSMLWLPLTSGRYDDLGRTCALLFPLFILLARIPWRIVFVGVAIVSAMFYALALATL